MIWFVLWLLVFAVGIFTDIDENPTLKKVCLFVSLGPPVVIAVFFLLIYLFPNAL